MGAKHCLASGAAFFVAVDSAQLMPIVHRD